MTAPCNCQKASPPDRIEFARCARGFIFQTRDPYREGISPTLTYAFDDIQDAASWLVDQYGEKSA